MDSHSPIATVAQALRRAERILVSTSRNLARLAWRPDPTPATKPSPSCRSTSRNAGC